jgi:hypothetical protein
MAQKKFINTSQFPMIDPLTGIRYEPGQETKGEDNEWVKGQEVIKLASDPEAVPQGEATAPGQPQEGDGANASGLSVATGTVPLNASAAPNTPAPAAPAKDAKPKA